MFRIIKQQRGAALILFVLLLPCLFGIAALAVDFGLVYAEKIRLQNMVDAAVLAGAHDLPFSTSSAVESAISCAQQNGLKQSGSYPNMLKLTVTDRQLGLEGLGTRKVPGIFNKLFGFDDFTLSAKAKAKIAPLKSTTGVLPLGIVQQNILFNRKYTLTVIPKNQQRFTAAKDQGEVVLVPLALGNKTRSNFETNIRKGFQDKLAIDDWVELQGNIDESLVVQVIRQRITESANAESLNKLLLLPVIADTSFLNGKAQIVGFAWVNPQIAGQKGGNVLEGEFKQRVSSGKLADTAINFGAYASALVE